jgi:hypothetical protein
MTAPHAPPGWIVVTTVEGPMAVSVAEIQAVYMDEKYPPATALVSRIERDNAVGRLIWLATETLPEVLALIRASQAPAVSGVNAEMLKALKVAQRTLGIFDETYPGSHTLYYALAVINAAIASAETSR